MTISQELDLFIESIPSIPLEKKYWLVRTQGGILYETFRENGIIALEHDEVPLSFINDIRSSYGTDHTKLSSAIKNKVVAVHESRVGIDLGSDEELDVRKAGLIASQISKFVFDIKKGDVVIIPSSGSDYISFGIVKESFIGKFSSEEERRIDTDAILKKRVTWIEDIPRIHLDPLIYRMFTAHQALNDVGPYANAIERSLSDFFILDDEAHIIINVQASKEIPAQHLFGLGSEILRLVEGFSALHNLDLDTSQIQVTMNLNSPGKIDLKSIFKRTTVVTGLILACFGGGYETKDGTTINTKGIPGLIQAVDDYRNHELERSMKQDIFEKYKDSLQIKESEALVKLLKQFSDNKDKPQ